MKKNELRNATHVRNFIFGVEDSLVSTVGLLSGIAVGGVARSQIVLTGMVLLFVEAFSMGVGSLLSEQSAREYLSHKETSLGGSLLDSIIMFTSYFVAGFIPLSPYFLFDPARASVLSVTLTLCALFLLGSVSGKFFGISVVRNGVRTLIMGGVATAVGVAAAMIIGK
ncbi:hypothetical protein A2973_05875 [Candidatus Gottesmanbacteria bacterium RIFCSPLOWO2_01_FULL_49_10]|uniref:VIT family protein n=1 Tax=Candidatus Gottesmanbacteria bacterium RIFCSPLOWO2_01_FULL_49_10 TaxID=1798396 RepID=A0A1F6AX07_9BACT|nr:MAG: hypothetical protein UY10_C0001G0030 [Microgenomates group bacterium GW2011_GWA2_47_8]OGG29221.1 MAG: hypothetical protein A2973_05875 [Candidatus Gottesmanbacteria bacterium RIFCSPLOWO2_01_FULL_49_10]